ncbi:RbsD/FucU domain-containing protein [Nevskia soli]|jgi:hypothetical protein|uniref:RbsD/FucU domain-containing protein n=1 Tax=Nevskia soli TaxID=418856 RepID=UPI0015D7939F|nr:RbsD/FucU domain-containing protein [Nevskia soli]
MNISRSLLFAIATSFVLLPAQNASAQRRNSGFSQDWANVVRQRLPEYGHRNWIVIADSAYPAQSREGIETIVANADQITVLRTVLGMIKSSRHVRPTIYTDKELPYVLESEAPGVLQYRRSLTSELSGLNAQSLEHEKIISKLDETAKTFRVLIVKTDLAIPYTSVFIQLDCAYWSDESQKRLSEEMAKGTGGTPE